MVKYLYVLLTIIFTTYGQLVLKWRLSQLALPNSLFNKVFFLTKAILTDFYIFSGFLAAYFASMCWMIAIKKLQLNIAYPLMSLSFVLVFIFSIFIWNEKFHFIQIIGLGFILLGIVLIGYSMRVIA